LKNKKSRWSRGAQACALAVLLGVFGGFAAPVHAAGLNLNEAEKLVQGGRAADAYNLLLPHEDELAGEVRYDYLLGIAALDSGKPDKATLAFERVLAVDPNFAGARLDMARAYYHLGDLTRARAEFDTVLSQNPPPAARATITRYLEAIEKQEQAKKTAKSAYFEASYGRDSNVNNSTAQSQISVPALGNLIFTLDPTNVKRGDTYTLFGFGGDIAHEVGEGYAVFAGGDLRYRSNSSEDRFDYTSGVARTGLAWSNEANVVRATLSGDRYFLDHNRNRTGTALGFDWRHTVTPTMLFNAFSTYTRYRFDQQALTTNDFDQYLLGIGGLRLYDDGRSAVNASVFIGREDDTRGRADGNKNIRGLRFGGQLRVHERGDFFASVGAQRGTYDRENVAFQTTRADNQYDAVAGFIWRVDSAWSVRPQVLFIHNDSNIPIYAYKRTDVSITLRRDFR
jgi:outer membrane protein